MTRTSRTAFAAALCLALAAPLPGSAQDGTTIAGPAVALDGDTLWVEGTGKVRLWGISAPEMRDWPWGAYARGALDQLIGAGQVTCVQVDRDRHERPVALCRADRDNGATLGQKMIDEGWAVAYRIFTVDPPPPAAHSAEIFPQLEAVARKNRRGLWRNWPGLQLYGD